MKKLIFHILAILVIALLQTSTLAAGDVLRPTSPEVKKCIEKALPYLKEHLDPKKKGQFLLTGYGQLNLLAYAEGLRCLGNNSPYTTPIVMENIDKICKIAPDNTNTYVVGIHCMLLSGAVREIDKYLATGGSKSQQKNNELKKRSKTCLDILKQLTMNIQDSIAPNGSWGYVVGPLYKSRKSGNAGTNHSTGQYALLGLEAAISCGIKVDKAVLNKAAKAFIDSQNADGGWGYQVKGSNYAQWAQSYPAMAAVGLASLKITEEHLTAKNKKSYKKAVEKCLKYMEKAYTPKSLDDIYKQKNGFWCYQMYCVERAGVFLEIDNFGKKDWYDLGARPMIKAQKKNTGEIPPAYGSNMWSEKNEGTAFCVLFLSKGSANVRKRYEVMGVSAADSLVSGMMRLWNKIDSVDDSMAIENLRIALAAESDSASRLLEKIVPEKLFREIEKQQAIDRARAADITPLVNFDPPDKKELGKLIRFGNKRGFSKKFLADVVFRQPADSSTTYVDRTDLTEDLNTLDPKFYNKNPGDAWTTLEFWSRACGAFREDRKTYKKFDNYIRKVLKQNRKHASFLIYEILHDPTQKNAVDAAKEIRAKLEGGQLDDLADNAPYTMSLLAAFINEKTVLHTKLRAKQWDILRKGRARTDIEVRLLLNFQLNAHLGWKSNSELDHHGTKLVLEFFSDDADHKTLLNDKVKTTELFRLFYRFK